MDRENRTHLLWRLCKRRLPAAFGVLILFALAWTQGWTQATEGAITGSVKDLSGAVVPGATVTLINTEEGTTRSVKSNDVGDYSFLDVKAARYSVEVSAQGFDKWSVSGLVLAVRQELRLDVTLEVGAVKQEVRFPANH
jgi:hypothetical protein